MAGMVFLGAMAAFGLLSLLWVLLGWLLPTGRGGVIVWMGKPDDGIRIRMKWLQSLGFLRLPLLAVTEQALDTLPDENIEYCSLEQLCSRLEQERESFHGTGNGDSSGNHWGGGLPEL